MFTLAVFEQNGNFKDHYLLCGSLWVEAIGVVTLNEVMIVGENVNITSSVCRFKTSFDVCLYVCCTNLGFYEPKWDGRARFCVLFFLDVNNKRSQFEHLRIISCHLFSQHHGFSSTTTAYSDDWANQRWAFLLFLISNLPTDRWRSVEKFFPCTEAVLAFFLPHLQWCWARWSKPSPCQRMQRGWRRPKRARATTWARCCSSCSPWQPRFNRRSSKPTGSTMRGRVRGSKSHHPLHFHLVITFPKILLQSEITQTEIFCWSY